MKLNEPMKTNENQLKTLNMNRKYWECDRPSQTVLDHIRDHLTTVDLDKTNENQRKSFELNEN